MKTAFIGGGNMATALIAGLNQIEPARDTVRVSDPSAEVRERLFRAYGIECDAGASGAIAAADAVVLAVKPQVMPMVLPDLAGIIKPTQVVISVAAGITVARLKSALGGGPSLVRAMPNTPALLGHGITGLFATPDTPAHHRALADTIMGAVGETVWVESEALIDAVTAVSGSGPAYFYLLTEAMRDAGEHMGLAPEVAARLALHTAHGAGRMAAETGVDVADLRAQVTSPGGTTQAALEAFEQGGFRELVETAMQAAARRARELASEEQGG